MELLPEGVFVKRFYSFKAKWRLIATLLNSGLTDLSRHRIPFPNTSKTKIIFQALEEKVEYWMEKYDKDVEAKQHELDVLKVSIN